MCSLKFRDSVVIVVGVLLERFVLAILYLYYLIYYTLLQIVDVIRDSCLGGYIKCLGLLEKCLYCFSSHTKDYDSLEDVNIKITIANCDSDHPPIRKQISSSTMERVTAFSNREEARRKPQVLKCDDLFCGCHRDGVDSCYFRQPNITPALLSRQDGPETTEKVSAGNGKTNETII